MAIKLGNLVFLGHARMASTAISEAMLRAGGKRVAPNHEPWGGEGYKFCVIRHPLDVLATWYVVSGYSNMRQFLEEYNHHAMRRGRLFYLLEHCDEWIYYKNLEAGIGRLVDISLERVNTTPNKKDYMSYFNDEDIKLAHAMYPEDFALYYHGGLLCQS